MQQTRANAQGRATTPRRDSNTPDVAYLRPRWTNCHR